MIVGIDSSTENVPELQTTVSSGFLGTIERVRRRRVGRTDHEKTLAQSCFDQRRSIFLALISSADAAKTKPLV